MKKVPFFVLVMALTTSTVKAQKSIVEKKTNWGIKMGLNISNIRSDNGIDSDWKGGLATGIFFTIKAGTKLSIQPEFLYSSMGGKNVVANSESSLRLNYFSLPVSAKFRVNNKLALVAGPQVDVLIQAKTKNSNNLFAKVTDNYKENSFYGTAGFEFWPAHCFGLTTRYMYGLTNIAAGGNTELKNQGLQIMAAIRF